MRDPAKPIAPHAAPDHAARCREKNSPGLPHGDHPPCRSPFPPVASHSLAPNSPAQLGRAPERTRHAPRPSHACVSGPAAGTPGAGRWQLPALPCRCTRSAGVAAPPPCTTTRQYPRGPRGFLPERGCVRGAPTAAGWPHGKRLISTGAHDVSGLLRLVLGGHSRAPWVAAPPPCVPRASVVHLNWLDRTVAAQSCGCGESCLARSNRSPYQSPPIPTI